MKIALNWHRAPLWVSLLLLGILLQLGWRTRFIEQTPANGALLLAVMAPTPQNLAMLPAPERQAALTGVQARGLARLAERRGALDEAAAWLQAGGAHDPADPLTYFHLCRLEWERGRRITAAHVCQAGGVPATYWIQVGLVVEQTRNFPETVRYFQMAVDANPQTAEGWYRLGRAQFEQGRYADAIPNLEEALRLGYGPSDGLYSALGSAYTATGQAEAALATLEEGLVYFPEARHLYLGQVAAHRATGNTAAMERLFAQLLQLWPQDGYVWGARGELALAQGQVDQAITCFIQATAYRPRQLNYWQGLAAAALRAENTAVAADAYLHLQALAPRRADIWLEAGHFYLAQGEDARAQAALAHVLTLEPENEAALEGLAALASRTGEDGDGQD